MANWISLAVLSALAVSALSFPTPKGPYNIPEVGTGEQSQYYVLHSDGTYKYGHDTGDGAFESARSTRVGQKEGKFGYISPEGGAVNLQYEADEEGFVPSGSHLPEPHPDFNAAHIAAKDRPPFVDPLANSEADATYDFIFAADGQTRSEYSDATGNIKGSFSYADEDGIIRTYSYTAGKDIGFVVEGSDLPVSPDTPESSGFTPAGTTGKKAPASTYRGQSYPKTPSTTPSARPSNTHRRPNPSSVSSQPRGHFEEANILSQLNPDGSYSFEYETSSHSRKEKGDKHNNVDGRFDFVADDSKRREIIYEAGADTGFIAKGDHIPEGPIVPGAPNGQPTGDIAPVQEIPFVDPLANTNSDASYDFAFSAGPYTRYESADADGNIQGTYTIVDEDGIKRTYKFRAGDGIGYEAEEVSSSNGHPQVTTQSSSPKHPSSQSNSSSGSGASGHQVHQYNASNKPTEYGYVSTSDN